MTTTTTNQDTIMHSSTQPSTCWLIHGFPLELIVNILTYLRAYDLSAVQLTSKFFANPNLVHSIVHHTAHYVYPPELTRGYDVVAATSSTPQRLTYQVLRNMELLVVARVLNRPEPKHGGFYVSKSWCRTALRWLEAQQQEPPPHKKKLTKKQLRIRNRRLSDASPPWPNVNSDIVCPHLNLQKAHSKSIRARRKVLDKQAWKVLKKLYPDSTPLDFQNGECLLCAVEHETARKNELDRAEQWKAKRKRPLNCPLTRGVYTRSRGVPISRLIQTQPEASCGSSPCPLQPGIYHVLPRAWCHAWRRYIKTGSGNEPCAPNATALLCDAHRLPLIPPHLEAFLTGESSILLSPSRGEISSASNPSAAAVAPQAVVGMDPTRQRRHVIDDDVRNSLLAVGMSPAQVASQQLAMMSLERNNIVQQHPRTQQNTTTQGLSDGEMLDRENKVVVEVLTQEEYTALEQWWPNSDSNFSLRFSVLCDSKTETNIHWSTMPCRECDATRHYGRNDLVVRNRARSWVKKSSTVKKSPASLEY